MKAIMITGAGYPDMATRALVKKMSLKFPVRVPIALPVACIYLLVILVRILFGALQLFKEHENCGCM
jgi:hypothetical protein